jgi:hypothetical protein
MCVRIMSQSPPDAPELAGGLVDPAAHCGGVRGVDHAPERGSLRRQLADGGVDVVLGAGADRHRRPLGQQRLGDRPAEALGGSGDERSLAPQSKIHLDSPRGVVG